MRRLIKETFSEEAEAFAVLNNANTLAEKWLLCFYFVNTVFTTVGFGDVTGTNSAERIYCIFLMWTGTGMYLCARTHTHTHNHTHKCAHSRVHTETKQKKSRKKREETKRNFIVLRTLLPFLSVPHIKIMSCCHFCLYLTSHYVLLLLLPVPHVSLCPAVTFACTSHHVMSHSHFRNHHR